MAAFDFDTDDDDKPSTTRGTTRKGTKGPGAGARWLLTFSAVLAANLVSVVIVLLVTRWYLLSLVERVRH